MISLSCVMPVYNGERYLAPAIESIRLQTVSDFELIIINDGSTDSTPLILDHFCRRDARIRVLHQPNAGIVAALNAGVRAARAPLIARMDADDLALPDRFARQLAYMQAYDDCVLVGSRVIMVDADGYPIGDMVSVAHGHDVIDAALLIGGWPIVHPTVLFRRHAFDRVGGYRDGTFPNEDHDLFLRLAEVGRMENLPDHLVRYRRHLTSITFAKSFQSSQRTTEIIRAALRRRGRAPDEYRPKHDPKPPWRHRREWVWQALREGHIHTARRHAPRVIGDRPWSVESWRAAYCAFRGR
jgi:glycosyltransferase involved in cell wall biosynthesis